MTWWNSSVRWLCAQGVKLQTAGGKQRTLQRSKAGQCQLPPDAGPVFLVEFQPWKKTNSQLVLYILIKPKWYFKFAIS